MKYLMRAVCSIYGHDWSDPSQVVQGYLYYSFCKRCDRTIKGDWDHFEANRIWRHYRRGYDDDGRPGMSGAALRNGCLITIPFWVVIGLVVAKCTGAI